MIYLMTAFALLTQDPKTVTRQEKTEYNAAVAKCREGEAMIDSDPQAAIDKFTEIIGNSRIRLVECTIRIEQRPAEYSDPYNFLPYQFRGKARMNQVKKATPENAQKLVSSAIEDFQESAKRNVTSSADLQKSAEALLAKLKADVTKPPDTVKADPVAKFREKWDPLMLQKRFKAAKAIILNDSEGVSAEDKKSFLENTEKACSSVLINWVSDFRPRFISAMNVGLDQKTGDEFNELFNLPPTEELILSHPAVDWVRQNLQAFRDVQSQKLPPHGLAAAAATCAPLEEAGVNRWFRAVEGSVFQSFKNAITAEVDKSQNAAKADREKARAQADALMNQWKAFAGKLDAKFVERHKFVPEHESQLHKLFEGFPADLADVDKINLEAAFTADVPDAELAKIDGALAGLESRPNLSRESRQRIYTARITVAALRGLFNGKTEEAVAGELATLGQKLREAGGPDGDVKKYGPRVEKVFAQLR